MASMLDLPEELLVHICSYFCAVDKVNFSAVCQRFANVCCHKVIVCDLDLGDSNASRIEADSLKTFLSVKDGYRHIQILNLNYCYWLPSAYFKYIKKLHGLKELHVLDCRLSFDTMLSLIVDKEITSLSCSFGSVTAAQLDALPNWIGVKCLQNLTTLRTEISDIQNIDFVLKFLQFCRRLEKFTMTKSRSFCHQIRILSCHVNYRHEFKEEVILPFLKDVSLPVLGTKSRELSITTLLINGLLQYQLKLMQFQMKQLYILQDGDFHLESLFSKNFLSLESFCKLDKVSLSFARALGPGLGRRNSYGPTHVRTVLEDGPQMQCTCLSIDCNYLDLATLQIISRQCPELQTLSMHCCLLSCQFDQMIPALQEIAQNCQKLTDWNLSSTMVMVSPKNPLAAVAFAKNLTRLSVPVEWLLQSYDPSEMVATDGVTNNRKRSGVKVLFSDVSMKLTRMWPLTEGCPLIADLELTEFPVVHKIRVKNLDEALATISRFKHLQRLSLVSITNVVSGDFLRPILTKCLKLSMLNLMSVGLTGNCMYLTALSQSISNANALKELRLSHPRIVLTANLCQCLGRCPSLRTIVLSTVVVDEKSNVRGDLCRAVTLLTNLVQLCIWTQEVTSKGIQKFNSSLADFRQTRPWFRSVFENVKTEIKDHRNSFYTHPSLEKNRIEFMHSRHGPYNHT